jgi:hypothetical protein
VLGRVARATGALDDARRWYRHALATFDGCGARFEVGRTHLALAELTARAEDLIAAGVHLGEADRVFRQLGVPRYAQRTHALALRLGLPAPGPPSQPASPAER